MNDLNLTEPRSKRLVLHGTYQLLLAVFVFGIGDRFFKDASYFAVHFIEASTPGTGINIAQWFVSESFRGAFGAASLLVGALFAVPASKPGIPLTRLWLLQLVLTLAALSAIWAAIAPDFISAIWAS